MINPFLFYKSGFESHVLYQWELFSDFYIHISHSSVLGKGDDVCQTTLPNPPPSNLAPGEPGQTASSSTLASPALWKRQERPMPPTASFITQFGVTARRSPGSERFLTGEADLHEIQRVQREVGKDPAGNARHQILVPDVAEYCAPRRRPGRRLALARHGLRARWCRGSGTRCSGRHRGDGRHAGAETAGHEPTSGTRAWSHTPGRGMKPRDPGARGTEVRCRTPRLPGGEREGGGAPPPSSRPASPTSAAGLGRRAWMGEHHWSTAPSQPLSAKLRSTAGPSETRFPLRGSHVTGSSLEEAEVVCVRGGGGGGGNSNLKGKARGVGKN